MPIPGYVHFSLKKLTSRFLDLLRNSGLKKQVDECLDKKVIWPFPSNADGADSGYSERIALCKEAGYSLWKATTREEKNAAWTLLNGNLIMLSNIFHTVGQIIEI